MLNVLIVLKEEYRALGEVGTGKTSLTKRGFS